MQPLITYMQQLTAGDVLAWGGALILAALGIIDLATRLYWRCDAQKERDQ